jgi:saccharopine dehydrogenase-like NADP-dependent oxidoreductase
MKELDEKAKEKGLIFLNELGLDPGIDHLCTMKIID